MLRLVLVPCAVILLASPVKSQAPSSADRPVDKAAIKRIALQIEPGLAGELGRLPQYVEHFRHNLANDARLFSFSVTAEAKGDQGVRLLGFVEFPETRAAIGQYLEILGFRPVTNELETLPSPELGAKRFGFIKSFHSLSYAEPAEQEVVTDCLFGEPLFLLRTAGNHFLVHGGDGYLGYVAARDVHQVDEAAFAAYLSGPRVCLVSNHAGSDAEESLNAPAGSRLKFVREEGESYLVETPTGEIRRVAKSVAEIRELPEAKIEAICTGARQLLGTEYLWGGKTSSGVDCSGLVQVSFAGAGLAVPRDANQQFHMGRLTGTRWSRAAMRRGDTLYFLNANGRISHTGLYLGDDQFIHAVSPVVRINSFNPQDTNYDAARHASFAFARRLWE